jgi:site-specific DNA-methyltransferase (adenine-specific)
LEDDSVDAVVCDPPYDLKSVVKRFGKKDAKPAKHGTDGLYARSSQPFVGLNWDTGEVAHDPEFWREVFRVVKPGGYVLAMSGSTTYHKLAMAIELAGFEVRDQLDWLYATGTPKSHPQGDDRHTALKPAKEPIVMARKPLDGTIKANLAKWGTGVIWLRGKRVPGVGTDPEVGGYPSNVLHDGSKVVVESLDGLATYLYCAKPSTAERNAGVDPLDKPEDAKHANFHPTVKPKGLMKWLVGLVTPPGGLVLDPFMGSGSTGIAAVEGGFRFLGFDSEEAYIEIARQRLAYSARKTLKNQ